MVIISLNKNKKNEDPKIFPKRKKKKLGRWSDVGYCIKKNSKQEVKNFCPSDHSQVPNCYWNALLSVEKQNRRKNSVSTPRGLWLHRGLGAARPEGRTKNGERNNGKNGPQRPLPPRVAKAISIILLMVYPEAFNSRRKRMRFSTFSGPGS